MSLRLSALSAFTLALAGCYMHHELAAEPARDAGVIPFADAGHDASLLACPSDARAISVRVEPITSEPERCAVSHVDGLAIYEVVPELVENGIRIRADFCPGADADCRCDIVLTNTGIDLTLGLEEPSLLTLDIGPDFVLITKIPTCECCCCPCSYPLVLYAAADTGLTPAVPLPFEVSFSQGDLSCPPPSACDTGTWRLSATSLGEVELLSQGEQHDFGGGVIHVRSVQDLYVFRPCERCASCGVTRGSWLAWIGG